MKIIVTGALGFIGSRISQSFQTKGFEVIGWDINNYNDFVNVKQVNMLDEKCVETELKNDKPDIIVHCAGSADVGKSVLYPTSDYQGNVTITHNLLFSLINNKMYDVRVVFLSSASVYGNPGFLPISENADLNPLSPYAVHKVMCEELCDYVIRNYGMDIKIARIFSAYGKGLKKQIFWDMHNKLKRTKRLDMFGTGNESRDYIHVEDVVQALYLLSLTNSDMNVFNVANGEEITIKQVVELFADCSNVSRENISFNGIIREGDPLNWKADISRIKSLGYKKTVDMKYAIEEYVNWVNKVSD